MTKTKTAKRPARTLDERIAELEAEKRKREAKAKDRAVAGYEQKVAQFERSVERTRRLGNEIAELAARFDFDLPALIEHDTLADQAIPDPIEDAKTEAALTPDGIMPAEDNQED